MELLWVLWDPKQGVPIVWMCITAHKITGRPLQGTSCLGLSMTATVSPEMVAHKLALPRTTLKWTNLSMASMRWAIALALTRWPRYDSLAPCLQKEL